MVGHQAGSGHEMQPGERFRQPFIIPRQAAEACHPGERPLDDPAPWERDEAALGRGRLEHEAAAAAGSFPV